MGPFARVPRRAVGAANRGHARILRWPRDHGLLQRDDRRIRPAEHQRGRSARNGQYPRAAEASSSRRPARIIEIGAGPGAHARWLTRDGYDVDLVDPVPRHVEEATAAGFRSVIGDARALAAADDSYDVALVLGPLYHLIDRAGRIRALREAARVVRPGGTVAAAAIGRYASLFEHVATTRLAIGAVRDAVADVLASGSREVAEFVAYLL
ncbi:class I SAM-dependent methyltransferase [Streptomyces sp. AB3(2024)]|uniref:class I SAM-dependent methyltransferase n=1 Tax=Streptomyces sp. AB3(2024) TaxID=3317321 RepID=UPI0035A26372